MESDFLPPVLLGHGELNLLRRCVVGPKEHGFAG